MWLCLYLGTCLFFLGESFNLWRSLLMIALYHQTKTPINFWCRRGLNTRFLIQPSETLPFLSFSRTWFIHGYTFTIWVEPWKSVIFCNQWLMWILGWVKRDKWIENYNIEPKKKSHYIRKTHLMRLLIIIRPDFSPFGPAFGVFIYCLSGVLCIDVL